MLSGNFCFWHILTVYVSVFHFTRYAFNETLNQRKKKKKHYKPKQCSVSIREEENSGLFSSLDKAHLSSLPNQRCSLPVSRGGKNLCSSMESSPSHSRCIIMSMLTLKSRFSSLEILAMFVNCSCPHCSVLSYVITSVPQLFLHIYYILQLDWKEFEEKGCYLFFYIYYRG